MNSIKALKVECIGKSFQSFKSLPIGDYIVENFEKISTAHGDRIRVELQNEFVFLPERFLKVLTPEAIAELNASAVIMSFRGKDQNNQNRLLLDFDIIDINEMEIFARTQPQPPPTPPPAPAPEPPTTGQQDASHA